MYSEKGCKGSLHVSGNNQQNLSSLLLAGTTTTSCFKYKRVAKGSQKHTGKPQHFQF